MSEPVFQRHARTLTLAEIVALTGAKAPPARLLARAITDIAALDRASPSAIAFFDNRDAAAVAAASHAGACLTTTALAEALPERVAALVVGDPFRAFVDVARELFPRALRPSSLAEAGSLAGANVHPTARLESGVTVEPGAVIGPRVEIGGGTIVGATAVVGAEVRIGRDCSIGAGAVITDALIGDRVIIHSGCRIGQDGVGFVLGKGDQRKMPQVGRVIIQDGVEIGAGTAIDRGGIGDTVIGEGSKIDNLVQVGQNARLGRHCIVAAQSGIPSCATLEDYAMLGAREGLDLRSGG
jgi:UDP-3-O-[3-hydroxymyristoyl] glucosamine N-acyltransferase